MTTLETHPTEARRVPVEHRFLGLDRRTLPFALVALGVWLLWAVAAPFADDRIGYSNPVRAGDQVQVTDDGVVFTPAAGWDLTEGLRTTERTRSGATTGAVVLVTDGVVLAVQPGPWSGTAAELLEQVGDEPTLGTSGDRDVRLVGEPVTISTTTGIVGAGRGFSTNRSTGIAAAYVFGDDGILIEVLGPPAQIGQRSQEIVDMIASFRSEEPA